MKQINKQTKILVMVGSVFKFDSKFKRRFVGSRATLDGSIITNKDAQVGDVNSTFKMESQTPEVVKPVMEQTSEEVQFKQFQARQEEFNAKLLNTEKRLDELSVNNALSKMETIIIEETNFTASSIKNKFLKIPRPILTELCDLAVNTGVVTFGNHYKVDYYSQDRKLVTNVLENLPTTINEEVSVLLFNQDYRRLRPRLTNKSVLNHAVIGLNSNNFYNNVNLNEQSGDESTLVLKKAMENYLSEAKINSLNSINKINTKVELDYCVIKLAGLLLNLNLYNNCIRTDLVVPPNDDLVNINIVEVSNDNTEFSEDVRVRMSKGGAIIALGPSIKSVAELTKFSLLQRLPYARNDGRVPLFNYDHTMLLPTLVNVYTDNPDQFMREYNAIDATYFTEFKNVQSIFSTLADFVGKDRLLYAITSIQTQLLLENYMHSAGQELPYALPYSFPQMIGMYTLKNQVEKDNSSNLLYLYSKDNLLECSRKLINITSLLLDMARNSFGSGVSSDITKYLPRLSAFSNQIILQLEQLLTTGSQGMVDLLSNVGCEYVLPTTYLYARSINIFLSKINFRAVDFFGYHTIKINTSLPYSYYHYITCKDRVITNTVHQTLVGYEPVVLYSENGQAIANCNTTNVFLNDLAYGTTRYVNDIINNNLTVPYKK